MEWKGYTLNRLLPNSALRFWHGRRQIAGLDDALEIGLLVGSVAKGLGLGMPAAAEANRGSTTQAEGLALLVLYLEVAFYAYRAIVANRNLCGCHPNPP